MHIVSDFSRACNDGGGAGGPAQGAGGPAPAAQPPMVIRGLGTEGKFHSVSVDWLRYSVPGLGYARDLVPDGSPFELADNPSSRSLLPLRFYEYAVRLACGGRIDYTQSRLEQGRLVTFDGSACRFVWDAGYGEVLLRYASQTGRATRVDVALDVVGASASPADVVSAWRDGRLQVLGQSLSEVRDVSRAGGVVGHTVYIGARESLVFVRVYDKGAREGVELPGGWLRVELECKGAMAQLALQVLIAHGVEAGGLALMRFYVQDVQGVSWWDDVFAGRSLPAVVRPVERLTDRQRWYRDSVLPALRADLARDDGWLRSMLLALVGDLQDAETHGGLRPVQSLRSARARAALAVLERDLGMSGGLFRLAFGVAGSDVLYGLLARLGYVWDARQAAYVPDVPDVPGTPDVPDVPDVPGTPDVLGGNVTTGR